jgi:hypothetical protein
LVLIEELSMDAQARWRWEDLDPKKGIRVKVNEAIARFTQRHGTPGVIEVSPKNVFEGCQSNPVLNDFTVAIGWPQQNATIAPEVTTSSVLDIDDEIF